MLLHALNYANGSANAHTACVDVLLFDVYIHIFLTVYFSKSQHQRACEHCLLKLSLHIFQSNIYILCEWYGSFTPSVK